MIDEFVAVIAGEVIVPVVLGYFLPAEKREIRRWKLAAWAWLFGAITSIALASLWLSHPIAVGLAIGAGVFSLIASFVASGSASILRKRGKTE